MKLTVLGSGTVSPSAERTSAAHVVESEGVRLLMDCGAGTLHRAATYGIAWNEITHVAITHFHADHWGELPAFIFAQKWGATQPREEELVLIGPRGFRDRLDSMADAMGPWVLDPGFPLSIVEMADGENVALSQDVSLACCNTPHTDESLAFAIESGKTRLVYTGDTGPSDGVAEWSRDCDLLLCECSLPESMAVGIHLTPRQAGMMGRQANSRRLVLTHLYPVLDAAEAARQASEVYQGEVAVASDGQVFVIGAS